MYKVFLYFAACALFIFGCGGTGYKQDVQNAYPAPKQGEIVLSDAKAIQIARKELGLVPTQGMVSERRGKYMFVAPPLKLKDNIEKEGVWVSMKTGEVFRDRPTSSHSERLPVQEPSSTKVGRLVGE